MTAKNYNVWTHYEVTPIVVTATSRAEALAKGIALNTANPPQIAGGHFGAEYAGSDGRAFIPSRAATVMTEPYARVKPKVTNWHKFSR
jgi:hypothetical protein